MEVTLNRKETKRVIRLLRYLSVTGQLGLKVDQAFLENLQEHYGASNE